MDRRNLARFTLMPGQRHDTVGVAPLIEGLSFDALIADKAFDSNAIIGDLDARGVKAVISQHPRRSRPLTIDQEMYKWRHLIENFFGKLKETLFFGLDHAREKIGARTQDYNCASQHPSIITTPIYLSNRRE